MIYGEKGSFSRMYTVVNRSKKYPDPVSEHDIALLEQMGATIVIDETHFVVYIVKGSKRTHHRRPDSGRRIPYSFKGV